MIKIVNYLANYGDDMFKKKKKSKEFISQKIFKVGSIILLVFGILFTVFGIFLGAITLMDASAGGEGVLSATVRREDYAFCVLILFEGTIAIVTGMLGFRAAHNLLRAKVVTVIIFIMMLSNLGDIIVELITHHTFDFDGLINFLLYMGLFMIVMRVRKHLREEALDLGDVLNDKDKVKRHGRDLDDIIMWSIAFILVLFSFVAEAIGYNRFTITFLTEYSESLYRTAITASNYVDADDFEEYIEGVEVSSNYEQAQQNLDRLCNGQEIESIDVVIPNDTYQEYTHIFCSVNKDNDKDDKDAGKNKSQSSKKNKQKVYKLGDVSEETNSNYIKAYKRIYEGDVDNTVVESATDIAEATPFITTFVPIKNDAGEIMAVLSVKEDIGELENARTMYVNWISGATLYIVIFAVILISYYVNKEIAKPLQRVKDEAERFASESSNDIKVGEDLESNVSRVREINSLNDSVYKLENDTINYIDNLTKITSEKEKLGAELKLAGQIQEQFLPTAFPNRKEFDLYATMNPAKEVGGDFYDFFMIDDDHLAMVIADVSDKGVPASLFMMVTKILISEYAFSSTDPAEILRVVNNRIRANNKENMFVTVWLGIMELSTGKLTTSNAGHEYPAIMRNNGDFEFYIDKHGLPLGVKKNYSYVNHEIMLEDGDKIFVYTDGITEASTSDKMMFGEDRLIEALNNHKSLDCKDLLEGVVNSVETFVGDATQFDDMTALCFEKKGNAIMEKSFKADVAELYSVLEYFESKVSDALDIKTVGAFNVAIEEVFVNIASYAYEGEGNTVDVSVTNDYANRLVKVVFKDSGVEFDPLAKSDPDVTLPAKKRAIGGLGIFMTKKLMDSVSYERVNDKNVLTIEKAY